MNEQSKMSNVPRQPVLLIGGSGVVGAETAKTLRQLQPELPITIGARNVRKAGVIADQIGRADVVQIDLEKPDLGLSGEKKFSAVAMFMKDKSLYSLKYAQNEGIPYQNISGAAFELSPEIAYFVHRPTSAPILMNSYWLAGTVTLAILSIAREFSSVNSINIAALLDEQDIGGPAAYDDFKRLSKAGPYALMLKDRKWNWAIDDDRMSQFESVDGKVFHGEAYSAPLDVAGLAAATNANSIRFDFTLGETASRRRGESFSIETIIEISGKQQTGSFGNFRYEMVHPKGQVPMTALGVAVGLEHLLGLVGGSSIKAGLYFPEVLIEPSYMMQRLKEFGTNISQKK
ncbi:hypothetical protein [Alkalihalobacillus hemicellulosilyticus]|uniref:Saccharopine dehydrogenase n=1 Tax=Halalkalibacter hemicellulosilyticusJCM 9152 TaxID=1236971 RepID=W4Q9P0_9BACI|nr:hypothetical protein [Halalkalibacter hemicellulosilyticus]GAE28692.1 hypothetical protein JCM9152_20 [Halalkalibacter hemicellulosilyticusJCM 9152]